MEKITILKAGGSEPLMKNILYTGLNIGPPMEMLLDNNAIAWQFDPNGLYLLANACSEHQRCGQIKSETAFGNGIKNADKLTDYLPKNQGPDTFFILLGLDLEFMGNAFVEIIRAGRKIIGFRHIPARTMYVSINGGFVQWTYRPGGDFVETFFDEENIIHLKVPCVGGFHYASPTWTGADGMIELVHAATQYNASFFRNRSIPDYAIMPKNSGMISETAKTSIKDFFNNEYQGAENAHRAIYIPQGEIEFKKLTEDRKDADFLKLLDSARERIITAHGVPPRLLGIITAGQLGGGSEAAEQLKMFEITTLRQKRRMMVEQMEDSLAEVGIKGIEFLPLPLLTDEPENKQEPDPEKIAELEKMLWQWILMKLF